MSDWKTGLCACTEDCGGCILSYFCPCVVHGQNVEKMGQGPCLESSGCFIHGALFWCCCPVIVLAIHRGQIQKKYGISESGFVGNCLVSWCCTPCVIAQHKREIDAH
eukprot:m51a1_g14051 hypothetical protein (107) ;mRNA; f:1196002-1196496